MEKKNREWKFWNKLISKSIQKNNNCIYEWKKHNIEYYPCGHNHLKEDMLKLAIEEGYENKEYCKDCICGEKCIYNRFYMKNIKTNEIITIGSKCIKQFMPEIWEDKKNKQELNQKIKFTLYNKKNNFYEITDDLYGIII